MPDLLNKTMNLSQTGLLYNPQLQNAEIVEKLFVVRQKQFELLLNKILQENKDSIPQHHLIIGQRGMGKTTLLKRMEVELHKEQYQQQFIPLLYREEQYNVKDLAEFWLNSLDALADSLQSEKYPVEMVADIDKTIMELSRKSPKIISEEAHKYLMSICSDLHRRPVLLIDNIGLIFSRLDNAKENNTEQWALRKLLSENGAPIVVSGGVTLIDNINNYGMPFYDFFQIQQLYKLSFEEFTKLLINLATVTNSDESVFTSIQKNGSRQQSLLELTGGSPRLAVMLFEQIAKGFSSNIYDDLEKLADSITPLYKARFEELPAQQQIILDAIALNWDAISLNKLSTATRMQNNQLSPQLKRLVDDGWIETTPAYKAKGNAYFISERFFNIYYLIRNSSRRHKDKVYCLSKFLECFYGKEDLEKISNDLLKQGINSSEQMRLHLALSMVKTLKLSQRKKIEEKALETFLKNEKLCKEFDISGGNFLSKGVSLLKSEHYSEAVNYISKAIGVNKDDEYAWYFKGECLYRLKKYKDALVCFDKALEIDSKMDFAWMQKGEILKNLKKYYDAIECFDNVIKVRSGEDEYLLYNKGFCLFKLHLYEETLDCFNKVTELNSKFGYNWMFKGECLRLLYRFAESLDCYEQAIKLNPEDDNFWIGKGDVLLLLERYEGASACYEEAIRLNSKNEKAWLNNGICLDSMKKYKDAIDSFDKAIELDAKNPTAWSNKGYALIELGKYLDAVDAYKKSIEIDHENISSKFNLIFLYRDKLGEMNKAVELYNSIDKEIINENKNKFFICRYCLHKTLFELYNKNNGLARESLLQAFEILEREDKISSIANMYWWIRFGSVVIKLGYGLWLLAILEEKGYNIVLSPYYTAIQALEIEQQDGKNGKKNAEIYLKNRAVEISDPAKIIVEKMKKYIL
jgi:tetratricopeptide (TPR) repeat protein